MTNRANCDEGIEENLRTLGTDRIDIVNLRLMRRSGPDSLFDDQLGAMMAARDDGLIRAVGLSNVSLEHLLHALKFTEIACVQNAFHPADRTSQPVLDECVDRASPSSPSLHLALVRAQCWRTPACPCRGRVGLYASPGMPGVAVGHSSQRAPYSWNVLTAPSARRTWRPEVSALTTMPFKRISQL